MPLGIQENRALRLAAWLDRNQELLLPQPQPEDVGELREELRRALRGQGPPTPDPTRIPLPRPRPRYRTYHTDQAVGIGATGDRFTFLVTFPVEVLQVTLNINNGDPQSSHIHLLVRRGDDTTAGLTDDDLEFFTNPDPTAGIGALESASTGAGGVEIPVNQPLLDPPYRFHVRALNAAGAIALHFNTHFLCRIIEPEELDQFSPAPLLAAATWGEHRGHPMPLRRRLNPGAPFPAPRIAQVCSLGFCRNIPWEQLDRSIRGEVVSNALSGRETPGIRLLNSEEARGAIAQAAQILG